MKMSLIRPNLTRVKNWNDEVVITTEQMPLTALGWAFRGGTDYVPDSQSASRSFFSYIYIPIKLPTASGMPEDFTYVDIGLSPTNLADIYATEYGLNFLIEPFKEVEGEEWKYKTSADKLKERIFSVYIKNLGKYMKMLELQGYSYNPLWNVDGTEEYSFLENNGINDVKTGLGKYNKWWR